MTGLRLPVFAIFLGVCALIIGAWSLYGGAGFGTTILRVILTLVVLQVGYFLVLLVIGSLPEGEQTSTTETADTHDSPAGAAPETNK